MDIVRLPQQLGLMLRAARQRRKLTQADVGKLLGISAQAVSKLEGNAGRASFDRIHRLCLLLGLEMTLQLRDADAQATPTASVDW